VMAVMAIHKRVLSSPEEGRHEAVEEGRILNRKNSQIENALAGTVARTSTIATKTNKSDFSLSEIRRKYRN